MNIGIKILIVDDEQEMCEILKYNLMLEGYDAEVCYSAKEALEQDLSVYSLFILDIMMDEMNGFELARNIKTNESTKYTPIIFCSALSGEDEHIMGLNIGADDYITKPFRTREMLARVKSVLRRYRLTRELSLQSNNDDNTQNQIAYIQSNDEHDSETDLRYKNLRVEQNTKQCFIGDALINLTRTEYEMLSFFMQHRNSIYSREELLQMIWNNSDKISNRTIDTNITRLRKKLGKYGKCIATRTGYGYGFEEIDI